MKKLLAAIFLALLCNFSYAQDISSSLLWKISGPELEEPSYLYGTIHLICQNEVVISETMKAAFDSTDQLIMELDMDNPNLQTEMQQYSFNKNSENIIDLLSEDDIVVVDSFLRQNYNTELAQIGIFKPQVLSSMIMMKILPCERVGSLEFELLRMAAAREIEVIGLETVRYQMSLFDSIPRTEQVKWMVEMVKDLDESKKELVELTKIYQEQDIDKIYEHTTELPEYAEYEGLFLSNRNLNWIPIIEENIKKMSSFIAVGAGHLGSDMGVVKLLHDKGYILEPIYME